MILNQSDGLLKMWDPMKGKCISTWKIDGLSYCTVFKNGLVGCLSNNNKISIYY